MCPCLWCWYSPGLRSRGSATTTPTPTPILYHCHVTGQTPTPTPTPIINPASLPRLRATPLRLHNPGTRIMSRRPADRYLTQPDVRWWLLHSLRAIALVAPPGSRIKIRRTRLYNRSLTRHNNNAELDSRTKNRTRSWAVTFCFIGVTDRPNPVPASFLGNLGT